MDKKLSTLMLAILCGPLAGCNPFSDDPAIATCEAILKDKLKSPSSYKRYSADISTNTVILKYDAANSYNAILRDQEVCEFYKDRDGKVARIAGDKSSQYNECLDEVAREGHLASVRPAVELRKCGALVAQSVSLGISLRKAVGERGYPIPLDATKLSFSEK